MKKIFLLINIALALISSAGLAADDEISAELIGYRSCAPIIEELESSEWPDFCFGSSGVPQISFIAIDGGIRGIREESLLLKNLSYDGNDLRENRLGVPNYKFSNFPEISDSGQFVIFGIDLDPSLYDLVGKLNYEGELEVVIGTELIKAEERINLSEPFTIQLGTYTVTNIYSNTVGKREITDELVNSLKEPFERLSESDNVYIEFYGNVEGLERIYALDDEVMIESTGRTTRAGRNDFMGRTLDTPSNPEVILGIEYWAETKYKKINFSSE